MARSARNDGGGRGLVARSACDDRDGKSLRRVVAASVTATVTRGERVVADNSLTDSKIVILLCSKTGIVFRLIH